MHSRQLISPTQALYRVFVLPNLSHSPLTGRIPHQSYAQPPTLPYAQPFSSSGRRCVKTRAPEVRKELWNEEIPSSSIFLLRPNEITILDPDTGQPPEPVPRDRVIRSLNLKTERLVQVASGISIERGEQSSWIDIPLCKIVNKKEQHDLQKQRKEASKEQKKKSAVATSVKTLELNWAIDPNDLGHRLEKAREFLSEGRKVEIVLASKKRGRKATVAECNGLLDNVRRIADEVDAKQVSPMEGKLGGFSVLRFQGKAPV